MVLGSVGQQQERRFPPGVTVMLLRRGRLCACCVWRASASASEGANSPPAPCCRTASRNMNARAIVYVLRALLYTAVLQQNGARGKFHAFRTFIPGSLLVCAHYVLDCSRPVPFINKRICCRTTIVDHSSVRSHSPKFYFSLAIGKWLYLLYCKWFGVIFHLE